MKVSKKLFLICIISCCNSAAMENEGSPAGLDLERISRTISNQCYNGNTFEIPNDAKITKLVPASDLKKNATIIIGSQFENQSYLNDLKKIVSSKEDYYFKINDESFYYVDYTDEENLILSKSMDQIKEIGIMDSRISKITENTADIKDNVRTLQTRLNTLELKCKGPNQPVNTRETNENLIRQCNFYRYSTYTLSLLTLGLAFKLYWVLRRCTQ